MNLIRMTTVLVTLCALPALAASPTIGFAQATGYFKQSTRPTLYQPLNLLDGRELTAWCTRTGDHLEDRLSFGFKDAVQIDEVRVYTGNGFDDSTFQEFGRARKLELEGPEGAQSFTIADSRGLQSVRLNPPVTGAHMTLDILEVYSPEDPASPTCITDIVFYSKGKPLNGSWLTTRLKYDAGRAPILGTWFGGSEGAPDRFLVFYFDGTFSLSVEPWDPDEPRQHYRGRYKATSSRITFEGVNRGVGRKVARMTRGDQGDARRRTLTLEGTQIPEVFTGAWRSWK